MVAARHLEGDDEGQAYVLIDGNQAAMLAVLLQEAAGLWQERELSHKWQTQGDDD